MKVAFHLQEIETTGFGTKQTFAQHVPNGGFCQTLPLGQPSANVCRLQAF